MDTKSLKHHKKPKRNKSGSKKGNSDVLVVPPDILKKLGISIANTASPPQIPDNVNIAQSTKIVNSELATNLTSNLGKESNESSFLETANLMKKSVFLSPTFVPTVANVISGEVEISNNKSFEEAQPGNGSLHSIVVNKSFSERHDTPEPFLVNGDVNVNCDLTINGIFTTIPNINGDFPQIQNTISTQQIENNISVEDSNVTHNGYLKNIPAQNGNCSTTKNISSDSIDNRILNIVDQKDNVEISQQFNEKNKIMKGEIEANNITNTVQGDQIQISSDEKVDLNNCIFPEKNIVLKKQLVDGFQSLEGIEIQVEQSESEDKFITLDDITEQVQVEYNFNSLDANELQNKTECNGSEQPNAQNKNDNLELSNIQVKTSLSKKYNYLEENDRQMELIEAKYSSLGDNSIPAMQIHDEVNQNCLCDGDIQIEDTISANKNDSSQGNEIHLKQFVNDEIFLKEKNIHIDNTQPDSYTVPLEVSMMQSEPAANCVTYVNEVEPKSDPISLEISGNLTMQLHNLRSTEEQVSQVETDNNIISLEDSNLTQNICEDYLSDLLSKDGQLELADIDMQSDLDENETFTAFEAMNGNYSEFSEKEIIIQVKDAMIDNTCLSTNDSNIVQQVFDLKDSSIEEHIDTLHNSGNNNCITGVKYDADNIAPPNKPNNKINIISEEIIPLSTFKEVNGSQSPIIRSLTPIPLSTIIASKKINDSIREAIPASKKHPTGLSNGDLHSSETNADVKESKSLNAIRSPQQTVSLKTSIIEENGVLTKPRDVEQCETDLHATSLVNNGDLKNNNNVFLTEVINASVHKETKNSTEIDLLEPENANKMDEVTHNANEKFSAAHSACINTSQANSIPNSRCKQSVIKRSIRKSSDKNSNCGIGSESTDNFKPVKQIKVDESEVSHCTMTVENKELTKSVDEHKSINELGANGSEEKGFCDDQLNNILKSSKDNTNSHLDKVKEIAEYIKKFAHIYKGSRKGINKDKTTNKNKEIINSKSNLIKSKLCIQGVEKPGGKKTAIDFAGGIKSVKTYSKQMRRKKPNLPANILGENENINCNVVSSINDINITDIATSYKKQDFCLCCDFGRLDMYDNSYEHIHFWLRNNNSDLESILSIYKDDEPINNDRTKLNNLEIALTSEESPEITDICWNYFLNDGHSENDEDIVSYNNTQRISCTIENEDNSIIDNKTVDDKTVSAIDVDDTSKPEGDNKSENCESKFDGHIKSSEDNETLLDSDGNISYEIITIVEMEDSQNQNINPQDLDLTDTTPDENGGCNLSDPPAQCFQNTGDGEVSSASLVAKNKEAANESVNNKEEIVEDKQTKTDSNNRELPKNNTTNTPKEKEVVLASNCAKTYSRKRSLAGSDLPSSSNESPALSKESPGPSNVRYGEPAPKKHIKCGVCSKLLPHYKWERHVIKKHNYIAWKEGDSFDFEDPGLINNLQQVLKRCGFLKCSICHLHTKKFNKFMCHVKNCLNQKDTSSRRESASKDLVKCGVCRQKVQFLSWIEHMGKAHNYLAWIDGQKVLKMDDEAAIVKHLQNIVQADGCLICAKCGLKRKRAKLYLSHIETCDGTQDIDMEDTAMSVDLETTRQSEDSEPVVETDRKFMTCGVCSQEVPVAAWTEHIGREHNYMAWEEGTTPLNTDDDEEVWVHLQEFIRYNDGLICYKCGLKRKRVKLYLSHIKTCDGNEESLIESTTEQVEVPDEKKHECGVCNAQVSVSQWNEHIGKEHNYLAWKVGETPLDVTDEDAVKEHLLEIIRSGEGLICFKCGLNRRRVKLYLAHVRNCDGSKPMDESTSSVNLDGTVSQKIEITIDSKEEVVKCGVCDADVASSMWIKHIAKEHTYLAWIKDQEILALDDEDAVKEHLLVISRQENGLRCNKCGVIKKYPKSFQNHVKDCTGARISEDIKVKVDPDISSFDISDVKTETVMCGVCNNEINTADWFDHMARQHDYLAWIVGKPPLDLEDPASIQKHLIEVSRRVGGLKCNKCGLVRKYAKSYQQHVEICSSSGYGNLSGKAFAPINSTDGVECAVCLAKVDPRDWRDHAMKKHYNVAWIVGSTPIEINNPYGVEPYIKEYQQRHNNKLVCRNCGISRVSAVGFYAHIITCGKSEEEQEKYKSMCEICNNKYLRIYKSQHMTMHREKEYAQERKILIAKEKAIKQEEKAGMPVEIVGGRRKAAEKAKTVIEKYTSTIGDGMHCHKCGFSSEIESEMSNHVCVECKYEASDSDESVELSHSSEEEDEDSDIDSNISDEEREAMHQEQTKAKKHGDSSTSTKIQRLPYQVKNINTYMRKSAEEFAELHLTDKDIFPQWRNLEYEVVTDTELAKYMPPIEESCKVRLFEADEWSTYKRFEARKAKNITTLFTGACIRCVRWVPSFVNENSCPIQELMSVVTHLDSDIPRHQWHEKPAPTPALVQIWDCGNLLSGVPQFVMGLSLDCGVIWAIDWCPSGARDMLDPAAETSNTLRLGLIAVASANGSAYVFTVPHPSTIKEKDQKFIKLKPVVEMRLAMSKNRNVYQATAIKWSSQKGHAHVIVGYSDGTTAYYDLKNDSPILQSKENGVTIVHPYYDERSQSMCIEDVDTFPTRRSAQDAGVVAAGSVGGAGVSVRAGERGAASALQAHAAAARVLFPPHWPAALLAGDDNLVSQAVNELEWHGGGRRAGGMRACGGCAWCGRVAAAAAPLVRLMRPHPAYSDLYRQVIATIHMVPFGNKRKRKNDELSMIMEPITYKDAVTKYGIEFKQILAKDKHTQQKLSGMPREAYPERFPLSDITSMVFCPSSRNHHKLAIATHSGVIFIINV